MTWVLIWPLSLTGFVIHITLFTWPSLSEKLASKMSWSCKKYTIEWLAYGSYSTNICWSLSFFQDNFVPLSFTRQQKYVPHCSFLPCCQKGGSVASTLKMKFPHTKKKTKNKTNHLDHLLLKNNY